MLTWKKNRYLALPVALLTIIITACNGEQTVPELNEDRVAVNSVGPSGLTEEIVADSIVQSATVNQTPTTGPGSITDVILITGQSNALGSETGYDPILDRPADRFYAYTDTGWQLASLRQVWDLGWHPAKGLGDDPHNNFGFHFGKTVVQERSDRVVGIVLITAPGEGISHWDADNFFFNNIRNKVLSALNELPNKSGIDGILWHQGETDWSRAGSNDAGWSSSGSHDPEIDEWPPNDYYSDKLWNLINNFRMESWFSDERPFICGETARSPINDRLNALNRNADIWTACVPGEGLETYDEAEVHFTADALRQLGANYAEIYLQMTGS